MNCQKAQRCDTHLIAAIPAPQNSTPTVLQEKCKQEGGGVGRLGSSGAAELCSVRVQYHEHSLALTQTLEHRFLGLLVLRRVSLMYRQGKVSTSMQ